MSTTFATVADVARELVYPVVDELQAELVTDIPKDASTPLLGGGTVLDSLDVVTLIVAVEERIEASTGRAVRLVNERAMSRRSSPFRTLGTLSDYVYELLAREA
jgi:acyl carrier protein